jgi:hypothetical protein
VRVKSWHWPPTWRRSCCPTAARIPRKPRLRKS